MGRARARTTPPGGSGRVRWLRLEGRTDLERGLVLEFVAETERTGHGQLPHMLHELLAAGDRVRLVIRLGGPAEVEIQLNAAPADKASGSLGPLGGLGTPPAEKDVPPPSPAAEGASSSFPPSIEAAKEEEGGDAGKHDAPLSDGEGGLVVIAPALAPDLFPSLPTEPEPEERQVAITQEVTPLGDLVPVEPDPVPTCACGCGGELRPNCEGRMPRFLLGHATRLRTAEQRLQAGAKAAATVRGYERSTASPARVTELREQIQRGEYEPFAALRRRAGR